jgi:hypothetical protein
LQWLYAPSYSTTKAYPTLESKGHRDLKICLNSLFLLKDTDFLRCKIIAIDGAKAERIAVRKHTSIKRKFGRRQLLPF